MSFNRPLAALAAAATLLSTPLFAGDYTLGPLTISEPFAFAPPPNAPVAGGFMTLTNSGDAADRLVAVRSDAAGRMEIHEMRMNGDVMEMRELEGGVEIPAGETVTLQPGGLHVMFMGMKAPLAVDETVTVTLTFERAGEIAVEMPVKERNTWQMRMNNGGN